MREINLEDWINGQWTKLTVTEQENFLTFASLIQELKERDKKVDQNTLKEAFRWYNYFHTTPEYSMFCAPCRSKVVKLLLFIRKKYGDGRH